MENIHLQKEKIRQEIKILKTNLPEEEVLKKSQIVFSLIEADEGFINARQILIYWSVKGEVHTHHFIHKWNGTKTFYLPVVTNEILEIKRFEGEHKLIKSQKLNLMEPAGIPVNDLTIIDLAIIPGIAFDRNNNRLGRGKAYYDKLLKHIDANKIGVCFDFQFFESIPAESHDLKMNKVYYA